MFRFELKAIRVSQITAVTPKKTTPMVQRVYLCHSLQQPQRAFHFRPFRLQLSQLFTLLRRLQVLYKSVLRNC